MLETTISHSNAIVSVIIPTYNSQQTIVEAVESALTQSWPQIEVIVVDDGSTDNTRELLTSYLDRIHYMYQQNLGRSAARNLGIRNATGNYVAFLDADDTWYPNKIETQLAEFSRNSAAQWGYCGSRLITRESEPMHSDFWSMSHGAPPNPSFLAFESMLMFGSEINTSTTMVSRELLANTGGFDESLKTGEDTDLWIRLAYKSPPLFVPDILATRRMVTDATFQERWIAHESELYGLHMIRKNLEIFQLSPESSAVARAALCRAYFNSALIELSRGNPQAASEHFAQATEYVEPEMYHRELAVRLAHFVLSGARYHPKGPVYAQTILEDLLHSLQLEKRRSKQVSRVAHSEFFAAVSFMYNHKKQNALASHYAVKALRAGPMHWKNIGVWRMALNL